MAGEKGIWTPANVVTCVRIALIPVFMAVAAGAPALGAAGSVAAFVIYGLLSLTDKLDGYLARSRNEITDFVWAVFVILLREFLVSALRMVAASSGEVIAADSLGKAKTAVTMVALCGFYLAFALLPLGALDLGATVLLVARALFAAAVVLTVVSGAQYFWGARHVVFGRGA